MELNHPVNPIDGIKPPCKPYRVVVLGFMRGKGGGGSLQQPLTTLPLDLPTFKFKLFNIWHLLEVVVI